MSRSYRRRVLGLSWWDDEGAVDVAQYTGRLAALAEPPARCECIENGTGHVCRYCLARNAKWHNPLDHELAEPDDSGVGDLDRLGAIVG